LGTRSSITFVLINAIILPMDLYDIGDIVTVVGEVLVGWMAIAVHHRVRNEHKIDEKVFTLMRKENTLGKGGISLIIIGLIIRLVA